MAVSDGERTLLYQLAFPDSDRVHVRSMRPYAGDSLLENTFSTDQSIFESKPTSTEGMRGSPLAGAQKLAFTLDGDKLAIAAPNGRISLIKVADWATVAEFQEFESSKRMEIVRFNCLHSFP